MAVIYVTEFQELTRDDPDTTHSAVLHSSQTALLLSASQALFLQRTNIRQPCHQGVNLTVFVHKFFGNRRPDLMLNALLFAVVLDFVRLTHQIHRDLKC